jgi:hypothetical protein
MNKFDVAVRILDEIARMRAAVSSPAPVRR